MVEGLRASRPLLKFQRILPLAAVLFVSVSALRYYVAAPRFIRTPRGTIFSVSAPQTRPAIVATAVNLPASIFALPIELAVFRGAGFRDSPYYEAFRTVEFSLLGILFWFYAGRALDDWIAWRQLRSGSRWRLSDCLVAALIAGEATMLGVLFTVGFKWERAELWYLASSISWALVGYWAFLFRVFQFRAYPRVKTRNTLTS
jgi:hypothetical protein